MHSLGQLLFVIVAVGLAVASSPGRAHWASAIVLFVLVSARWRWLNALSRSQDVLPRITSFLAAMACGISIELAADLDGQWTSRGVMAIVTGLVWVAIHSWDPDRS